MIHNALQVQNMLRENGILISFSGTLSQVLIEEYGAAVKSYMESAQRTQNEVFHIFSIFIEQTQNIKNYCTVKQDSPYYDEITNSSIVTIGRTETGHYICSGNLVDKADLGPLLARIAPIVSADKTQLKQMYKECLRQETAEGGGAGLGLIEIARKAREPLEYVVTEFDANLSFFILKAVV